MKIIPEEYNKPSNWVFLYGNIVGKRGNSGDYDITHHENNLFYGYRWLVPDEPIGYYSLND